VRIISNSTFVPARIQLDNEGKMATLTVNISLNIQFQKP
jgi:hypothetical protein